jgi:hypothetical protein
MFFEYVESVTGFILSHYFTYIRHNEKLNFLLSVVAEPQNMIDVNIYALK